MKHINSITISKFKQFFHAYTPLVLLLILPHQISSVLIAFGYVIFAGYFYIRKAELKYPAYTYEYFLINLLVTLILLGGYVNGL